MPRWTPAQQIAIAQRRKRVADMRLEGLTELEIAGREGVSRDLIAQDMRAVRKEWEKERVETRDRWVAQELARIDAIERLARLGWARSLADAEALHVRTETEGAKDKDGKPIPTKTLTEKTTKGQSGDPRFLERIAWCVEQRLKVIGGYAPKEVELSGKGGQPLLPMLLIDAREKQQGAPDAPDPAGP